MIAALSPSRHQRKLRSVRLAELDQQLRDALDELRVTLNRIRDEDRRRLEEGDRAGDTCN